MFGIIEEKFRLIFYSGHHDPKNDNYLTILTFFATFTKQTGHFPVYNAQHNNKISNNLSTMF